MNLRKRLPVPSVAPAPVVAGPQEGAAPDPVGAPVRPPSRLGQLVAERRSLLAEFEETRDKLKAVQGQLAAARVVLAQPVRSEAAALVAARAEAEALRGTAAVLDDALRGLANRLDNNLNRITDLRARRQNAGAEAARLEGLLVVGGWHDRQIAEAARALAQAQGAKEMDRQRAEVIRGDMAAMGDLAELDGLVLVPRSRGRVTMHRYVNLKPLDSEKADGWTG